MSLSMPCPWACRRREPFGVHVRRGVDRGDPQLRLSRVGEAMSAHRGGDEDVSGDRRQLEVVDLEAGLSGVDDEHLRVGVAVKQRTCAGPVVDEEQRDRQPAVLRRR